MRSFLTPSPENPVAAVQMLLRLLGVGVSRQTLTDTLQNHPDYPSLLAMSHALQTWQVENMAVQIPIERLPDVPTPFIAHRKEEGGFFAVVRSFRNGIVEWQHPHKGWQHQPVDAFGEQWSGMILMAEATPESGEADYDTKHIRDIWQGLRLPVLLLGCVLLAGLSFGVQSLVPITLAWLGLKLIGTVVCGLLVAYTLDQSNPVVRQLCKLGNQTDCNAVLTSPAASIGGLVSLSEIGFVYFAGGWLALVFAGLFGNLALLNSVQSVLFWLTLSALPFTLVSVWYQGRVVRQWCVLCLTVVALLWVEAITGQLWDINLFAISGPAVGVVLASFLFPILGWVFVKRPLVAALALKPLQNDLLRLKNDPALFLALLHQQPELHGHLPAEAMVILGDADAPHTITIATSPTCPPCARLHHDLTTLLNSTDAVNVHLIFTTSDYADDVRRVVAQQLLSLPLADRPAAIDGWFTNTKQDPTIWGKAFTAYYEAEHVTDWLAQHSNWCHENQIDATPTVFLDGYRLPPQYSVRELGNILPYLPERAVTT